MSDSNIDSSQKNLIVSEFLTLDGVTEAPEEWSFAFFSEEQQEYKHDELFASGALLLGRTTYKSFVEAWPDRTDETGFADRMNSLPKYVVSTSLEDVEWNNSTLTAGNVEEEIAELKQREGEGIGIVGSRTLVRSLLDYGLLDELVLMVHPLVLGDGKRLFEEGGERTALNLIGSKTFDTGVVSLTYEPAVEEEDE